MSGLYIISGKCYIDDLHYLPPFSLSLPLLSLSLYFSLSLSLSLSLSQSLSPLSITFISLGILRVRPHHYLFNTFHSTVMFFE